MVISGRKKRLGNSFEACFFVSSLYYSAALLFFLFVFFLHLSLARLSDDTSEFHLCIVFQINKILLCNSFFLRSILCSQRRVSPFSSPVPPSSSTLSPAFCHDLSASLWDKFSKWNKFSLYQIKKTRSMSKIIKCLTLMISARTSSSSQCLVRRKQVTSLLIKQNSKWTLW